MEEDLLTSTTRRTNIEAVGFHPGLHEKATYPKPHLICRSDSTTGRVVPDCGMTRAKERCLKGVIIGRK